MTANLNPTHRRLYLALGIFLVAVLILPGASAYYEYSGGRSCARCHEIWQPYTNWHTSTHRNVPCSACHGDVFTLEAGFHLNNMRRLLAHLRGEVPEQVRLKTTDVLRMGERCRKCHQQEYADWAAGPHGATYALIFLDKKHNRQRHLMDDCLRCHGMHFEGGIRDLVTPIDTTGPWRLLEPGLANEPVIPCLACHQMHRQGAPLVRSDFKPTNPGPSQELFRPSLALFDRRELESSGVCRCPKCARTAEASGSVRTAARRSAISATRRWPACRSAPQTIAPPWASTKD